jgi:hypothetical protein
VIRKVRAHLTYANVTATVAVFIALGGTSYAVASLPRSSVGARELKANSVGSSEIRAGAVRSKEIRNGSIATRDISSSAKKTLRGKQGPQGPPGPPLAPLSVSVSAAGGTTTGNGSSESGPSLGLYKVFFPNVSGPGNRDMRSCRALATLSRVDGAEPALPPNGEIVTETTPDGVTVHTYNPQGQPANLPFHLFAIC